MRPFPLNPSNCPAPVSLPCRAAANPYSRQVRQASLILAGDPHALLSPMHRTPLPLQCATCPA